MVSEVGVVPGQHDDRRLEAVLAQDAHRFAPVDVGQADIHDHEIDLSGLGGLHALGAVVDRDRLEFLVQRELLDQRLAQLGIVVDDQDFAGVRHSSPLDRRRPGTALREVEHSGVKEQAGLLLGRYRRPGCGYECWLRTALLARADPGAHAAGRPDPGRAARRAARGAGRARHGRHPRQQMRGRRRHPARAVSACPPVVAGRPPPRPPTLLPVRRITADLAWCEDPPTAATIARSGARPLNQATGCGGRIDLYDFVIELDHNTRPRVAGRGSAVFVHLARPDRSDRGMRGARRRRSAPSALGPRTRHAHRRFKVSLG